MTYHYPEEYLLNNNDTIKTQVYRQELTDRIIIYSLNKNIISFDDVSKFQYLSEKIIEMYLDKWNWELISKFQCLSDSFREKYKQYLK